MVRVEYGRHKVVITGTDDAGKQVSKNAWNDDNEQLGVLGFDEPAEILLSSGVATPINTPTLIVIGAESGTIDEVDTVTSTNYQINDILIITPTAGDTITLNHATGNLFMIGERNITLSSGLIPFFNFRNGVWAERISTDRLVFDGVNLVVRPY